MWKAIQTLRAHARVFLNHRRALIGKRAFTLTILTPFLFPVESQAQYKPWFNGTPLVWNDFQGTPPPLSSDPDENHDAHVYTEILWDFTWDSTHRSLEVNAQAAFVQAASWYRPSVASASLLSHEIGHFDYAEVSARQLKQRIAESVELKDLLRRCDVTEAEIEALLTAYHAEEIEELEFNHGFYDSETDHSQNLSQQNIFTGSTIPNLLSGLDSYSAPIVSVSVENEGAVPVPGNYQGVLKYTLQAGVTTLPLSLWNWELQGQWNFSVTATETDGDSHWEHEYISSQYGGHLLDVTLPDVITLSNIPVLIQSNSSGTHFWVDGSSVQSTPMPSHEMTMAPFTTGVVTLPQTPDNTIIDFPNAGALALGTWMNIEGTPALKMRAPITCPNESIVHTVDMGHGRFFELEWTLSRLSSPQDSSAAGGAGGSGSSGSVAITSIMPDTATGHITITWEAATAGETYLIEYSDNLTDWTELDTVTSSVAGSTHFLDTMTISTSNMRFYRVVISAP